jgi:peptidoglycan/xylan/chitin deacetylase (PgdA/CDA1 family)
MSSIQSSLSRKMSIAAACVAAGAFGLGVMPGTSQPARAAVPANQAARSAVALAAGPAGSGYAFYRGQDDAVYLRTVRNGTWSAQAGLGGKIIGAPSATIAGNSAVVVGARGTDNALWTRTLVNGTWGGWRNWGGSMSASPALAGASDGSLYAISRGPDGSLLAAAMAPGGTVSGWTRLGGQAVTGPAAVSTAPGSVEVYAAGTDHAVWRDALSGGRWSGWKRLGGMTYSAPAAARMPGGSSVQVLVRGTDNALWASTGTAGAFGGWRKVGGVLIDGPAASGSPAPGVDVAVRGTDNAVWAAAYRSGGWSGFTRAWAPTAPPPPASGLPGTDWTRIPTSSKVVALTFDAGANAAGLPSIAATLRARKVPATFFLTGNWVRDFPAQANTIAQDGYLAGNHSLSHLSFTQLTDAQVAAQVQGAQQAILRANGADARPLFRFPNGDVNSRVLADVNRLGYVAVRWTVDSLGWQGTSGGQSVQSVTSRVLTAAQPGEIILMHLGSNPDDHTTLDANALPAIIDGLRARGYGFVTLQALTG